ncbi:hypothetical protein Z517_09516 [Fonsecaea pedrosoi CBS 271.37]|uniref:Aminoglycoside phosphotransferase domain-containing protein n=1 Tax=Fonsecaea pedrosoi CBS 271.37 TaxID=1442368 RepID=A0A0D2GEN9_9EURO|nr:uncharacterized protein Z517_09516 [Fonsecaea pedrosoi CBS 271.37]KIW77070.1 hypothetical protein Z517_09516 [Fonsecaea pedrosoi CBS 271.37]
MKYLARYTSIPVPDVLGSGTCGAGPYIVMSFVEGEPLAEFLKDWHQEGRPVLNPRLSDRVLKRAYREMAKLILELSKPEVQYIGALWQSEANFSVTSRPLTCNMNELATSANLPPQAFPTQVFESAPDFFTSLANQYISQLQLQRNDSITDQDDCTKKYVARCLFRNIAQGISTEHRNSPFRLHCDDFRPSNVLIDLQNLNVTGVVDWEFTYAAPAEFTCIAPWWVLLQSPEDWESDLRAFLERFMPRFRVFIEALREREEESSNEGDDAAAVQQRLSTRMEWSLETGLFWVCLAAKYSSMFDEIYWTFIDEIYHGPFTAIEDRLGLLTKDERHSLDELVRIKLGHIVEGPLDTYYTVDDLMDL